MPTRIPLDKRVGLTITIKPRGLRGLLPGRKFDFEQIRQTAGELAANYGGSIQSGADFLDIRLCPRGEICFDFNGHCLKGGLSESIAGVGFHAASVDFCEQLAARCDLKLKIYDFSGYARDRDFSRLRQLTFISLLRNILRRVDKVKSQVMAESDTLDICWPDSLDYSPSELRDSWAAPTGTFKFDRTRLYLEDLESFARNFYVWPNRHQDAYFYRNSALAMAWTDCYFDEDDTATCNEIAAKLEQAAELDHFLSFPKSLYLELCSLCGRAPIPLDKLSNDNQAINIGFHKMPLFHYFNNWAIKLPGRFRQGETSDCSTQFFHRDCTFELTTAVSPETAEPTGELLKNFENENHQCQLYRISPEQYLLKGQVTNSHEVLSVTCRLPAGTDYQWAVAAVCSCTFIRANDK